MPHATYLSPGSSASVTKMNITTKKVILNFGNKHCSLGPRSGQYGDCSNILRPVTHRNATLGVFFFLNKSFILEVI
jgi:hypothetical protein